MCFVYTFSLFDLIYFDIFPIAAHTTHINVFEHFYKSGTWNIFYYFTEFAVGSQNVNSVTLGTAYIKIVWLIFVHTAWIHKLWVFVLPLNLSFFIDAGCWVCYYVAINDVTKVCHGYLNCSTFHRVFVDKVSF